MKIHWNSIWLRGPVTYDFILHSRVRDHTTWFYRLFYLFSYLFILFGFATNWNINCKKGTEIQPPYENQHKPRGNQQIIPIGGLTFQVTTKLPLIKLRNLMDDWPEKNNLSMCLSFVLGDIPPRGSGEGNFILPLMLDLLKAHLLRDPFRQCILCAPIEANPFMWSKLNTLLVEHPISERSIELNYFEP